MSLLKGLSLVGLLLATGLPSLAQFDPQGAEVISYFPQLADGGTADQRWTTRLTLINPHDLFPAAATVYFYGDDGKPLSLDFGQGPVSSLDVTLASWGAVTYTSTGASSVMRSGWAVMISSLPLQGAVQYGVSVNGVPQQSVTAQSTQASTLFRSPATRDTGIAVANTYDQDPVTINLSAVNEAGYVVGSATATIPGNGHQAFTMGQMFPSLASTFRGSVLLDGGSDTFVAWTVASESGVLASYPPAGLTWPSSQYERIWKVWMKVVNSAASLVKLSPAPKLVIEYGKKEINTYANGPGNEVHMFASLAELISDSDSELGFVLGHEIAHIVQYKVGRMLLVPGNSEQDADEWGVMLTLLSGYDPYAGSGALAKLAMAASQTGMVSATFDNTTGDTRKALNDRLGLMFGYVKDICSDPDMETACAAYKNLVHPDLPAPAPLLREHRHSAEPSLLLK